MNRRAGWRAIIVTVAFSFVALTPLRAQRATNALDLSAGVRDGQQRAAVSLSRRWPVIGGTVSIGFGARVSSYRGDPLDFELQDEGAALAPNTLALEPRVTSVNLAVLVGLQLLGPLSVGANLDLIGYSTGPTTATVAGDAKPAGLSYFQNGTGDRGSLNSEFYGVFRLSRALSLRAGLSHYVLGIETTSVEGTSRYQRFVDVTFVALRYDL